MATKGHKSQRGQGEIYSEVKKRVSIALTETGASELDYLAESFGLSRSEFVERIGRSTILVAEVDSDELVALLEIAKEKGVSLPKLLKEAIHVFIKTSSKFKKI